MKKLSFLLFMSILAGSLFAADEIVPADNGCRTQGGGDADINQHDSEKLSVREITSSSGNKSWIKFDQLDSYDLGALRDAVLTVKLLENKAGAQQCDVSAVNDDVTDNILWVDHPSQEDPENDIYALTWNNAPGNKIDDWGLLDPCETTYLDTIIFTDGLAGDAFDINVLSILQADTDGTVQFVLHNSHNLLQFATWDHPTESLRPYLTLTFPPPGADWPNPADESVVPRATTTSLSWTNPDPNSGPPAITPTVYLQKDGGVMDIKPLPVNTESVAINETNFPNSHETGGMLYNDSGYTWRVDCVDPSRSPSLIPGEEWSFFVGQAPSVDAGPDKIDWLDGSPVVIAINATVTDDVGIDSYTWEQVANGAPAVEPDPNDAEDTSVTITARGDYEFMLTASDGNLETSDTVRVVVGDDACDASHLESGAAYNDADENQDCLVDVEDFLALIIEDWLDCTDILTNCGN